MKQQANSITDYHAKYYAYQLTKRCPSDSMEKLASTLVDAQVDRNPHQIEEALFAFRSPLSRGLGGKLKVGLEREIKESDRQIKEVRNAAVAALTLEENLAGQKQIKALESERGKRRRALFDAQDQIDQRRDQLIAEIERKLQQKVSSQQLFPVRWQVQ